MADTEPMTLESTLAAIADLWGDERCSIEFQYVPAYYRNDVPEHAVVLEWTDDSAWLNNTCTYVTYRWQFDHQTFAAAALDALAWVTALTEFKTEDD